MSSPKRPEPTAQEQAIVQRQTMFLDDEIEETESRLRAISRRSLGSDSLLTGAPANARQAASGRGASMFQGGGRGSSGSSSGSSRTTGANRSSGGGGGGNSGARGGSVGVVQR